MKTTPSILIGARRTIKPQDVILFTADINYTQVYFCNGRKLIVATPLKIIEKRFAECSEFFRTHRSYLINLNYVKQFASIRNELFVQMENDYRVAVSRRKREAFKHRILAISH